MASNWVRSDRDSKIVILDTNAILMLFKFNINLDKELLRLIGKYKIIIPKEVLEELMFFSKEKNGKIKAFSNASLSLIKDYEVIEANEKNADKAVLSLAKKINGYVVTNDKELRKTLKKNSIKVLYLRAKKKLELV